MRAVLRQFAGGVVDVVFPRVCVGCSEAVEAGVMRHLCGACSQQLQVVEAPHCPVCGHPFFGEMEENRLCAHCEALVPTFDEGRTAVLLKGAGRSLVHALKYHGAIHVLEDFETVMRLAPGYVEYLQGKVLVPVPLHPRKLRERGYNQSLLLAECAIRAAAGAGEIKELLVRRLDTESQTHFDRTRRQENLKNAFALADGVVINPGLSYLLIDDVFTTGSTLNACAAVLRDAGALRIDVVTFGHG